MKNINKRTTLRNRLVAGTLAAMTLASVSTLSLTTASAATTDDDIAKALSGAKIIGSNISVQNPFTDKANTGFKSAKLEDKVKALANSTEKNKIDEYINNLKINNKITSTDSYNYKPIIGNKANERETRISPESIENNVFITNTNKLKEGQFFREQKSSDVLSGIGLDNNLDYIYPGNILMIEESSNNKMNVSEGKYRNMDLAKRASGTFVINNDTDKEFVVDDMSSRKDKTETRACDEIQNNMYTYLAEQGDTSNYYVIRIASATSPEQLSATLNLSEGAIKAQIDSEKWDDIRSGKKQVSVVSVQQIVASVEMTNDLTHPSDLFSKDASVVDISKISSDGKSNAMLITKVNYGRQYLLTAELNLRNTAREEHVDLTSGLIKLFRSNSDLTASEKNAMKYAKVNASEIGYSSIDWQPCKDIHSVTEFIKHLSKQKVYTSDLENLVPVSYEAVNLAGSLPRVMMNIQADEYEFKGVSADKIKNVTFRDDGDGKNYCRKYWSYGIDLDKYNATGEIVEKQYLQVDGDTSCLNIPAYQCIFGVSFNLDGGVNGDNGNVMMYTKKDGTRLYQNSGFSYLDDNGNKITGRRIDLSNMSLKIGTTYRSVGYNRNYLDVSFNSRNNSKLKSQLVGSSFHSNAGDKSGSGWTKCWAEFSYDNTLDINGNGLKLNNDPVDNTI